MNKDFKESGKHSQCRRVLLCPQSTVFGGSQSCLKELAQCSIYNLILLLNVSTHVPCGQRRLVTVPLCLLTLDVESLKNSIIDINISTHRA